MKIVSKRTINAPQNELWPYLADFANIHRFHPMLKDSYFIKGSDRMELGAKRQCDFKDGNYLHEKVTDLKEGQSYSIEITDSSLPTKDAKASLSLKSLGDNKTEVTMEVSMIVTNPVMLPMFYLMYKFKGIPSILKGLEDLHKSEHELVFA